MPIHRFTIGAAVRLKSKAGLSPRAPDTYRIIGFMPTRENSPQYRLRNDEERHERVSMEDNLEVIEASSATR